MRLAAGVVEEAAGVAAGGRSGAGAAAADSRLPHASGLLVPAGRVETRLRHDTFSWDFRQ